MIRLKSIKISNCEGLKNTIGEHVREYSLSIRNKTEKGNHVGDVMNRASMHICGEYISHFNETKQKRTMQK
jgi:hypothetical protein